MHRGVGKVGPWVTVTPTEPLHMSGRCGGPGLGLQPQGCSSVPDEKRDVHQGLVIWVSSSFGLEVSSLAAFGIADLTRVRGAAALYALAAVLGLVALPWAQWRQMRGAITTVWVWIPLGLLGRGVSMSTLFAVALAVDRVSILVVRMGLMCLARARERRNHGLGPGFGFQAGAEGLEVVELCFWNELPALARGNRHRNPSVSELPPLRLAGPAARRTVIEVVSVLWF